MAAMVLILGKDGLCRCTGMLPRRPITSCPASASKVGGGHQLTSPAGLSAAG